MKFTHLGKTSIKIPRIIQGTTGTGPLSSKKIAKDQQRIDVLRYGIELGLNFIDTAELYGGGHAEEIVGKAIRGVRSQVIIASKVNPENCSKKALIKALDASLKRIGTDYLDLYQIHWPNPDVHFDETFEVLELLIEQGKIRWIGLSNFSLEEVKRANSLSSSIVSLQMEYNPIERGIETEILSYCHEYGITLIAYSALSVGAFFLERHRTFLEHLEGKYHRAFQQLIIKWLLRNPSIVVAVKSTSLKHTEDNALYADFELYHEDIKAMSEQFYYTVQEIPTAKIRIVDQGKPIYCSLAEANDNRLDLIPDPKQLAQRIIKYNISKPVWLIPSQEPHQYELHRDHLFYWAWIIAYEGKKPIPAYIL
jgi:aryl-alcohol dehydrogenase-like predicted oxidoreductase